MDTFKYWGFISYSHTDHAAARHLHNQLERYRVPRSLRGQPRWFGAIPDRLLPFFRDEADLSAAPDLPQSIQDSLSRSRFLIVVCSPAAARSRWVAQEIRYFQSLGRGERIFCLLTAGEPYADAAGLDASLEAIPAALRYRSGADGKLTSERASEVLAADSREIAADRKTAHLKLLAGMLGVEYDLLRRRQHQRFLRRLSLALAAACSAAVILGALSIYAFQQRGIALEQRAIALDQRNEAQTQARIARAGRLVAIADSVGRESLQLGLLLAAEAHRIDANRETREALFNQLAKAPAQLETFLGRHAVHLNGEVVLAETGAVAASSGDDGWIRLWSLPDRKLLGRALHAFHLKAGGANPNPQIALSADGALLAHESDEGIGVFDVRRGEPLPFSGADRGGLRFLASGKQLLIVDSGQASIVDIARGGKAVIRWPVCCDTRSFAVDRKETLLFTVHRDGALRLWDVATGRKIREWSAEPSSSEVTGAIFDPTGRNVAYAVDQELRVLDVVADTKAQGVDAGSTVIGIRASPAADRFLTIGHESIRLWEWSGADPHVVTELTQMPDEVFLSAALVADRSVVTMSHLGVRVWDVEKSGSVTMPLATSRGTLLGIAMDVDREHLLVLLADDSSRGMVERWQLSSGRKSDEQPVQLGEPIGFNRLSADGQIVTHVGNQSVHLTRRSDGRDLMTFTRAPFTLDDASRWLFHTSSDQRTLQIVEIATGAATPMPIDAAVGEIYTLEASPPGDKVAIAAAGGLFIYERNPQRTVMLDTNNDIGSVSSAVWSAGGERLAGEIEGKALMVFSGSDYRRLGPIIDTEHRAEDGMPLGGGGSFLSGVRFHTDPHYLWTLDRGGALRLWHIESGSSVLAHAVGIGEPFIAKLPADTPHLVVGSYFGGAKVLDFEPKSWHRKACGIVNRNLTCREWEMYGGGAAYEKTCDNLPGCEPAAPLQQPRANE